MSWLVIATGGPDSVQAVCNATFVRLKCRGEDGMGEIFDYSHAVGCNPTLSLRLDLNGRQ